MGERRFKKCPHVMLYHQPFRSYGYFNITRKSVIFKMLTSAKVLTGSKFFYAKKSYYTELTCQISAYMDKYFSLG